MTGEHDQCTFFTYCHTANADFAACLTWHKHRTYSALCLKPECSTDLPGSAGLALAAWLPSWEATGLSRVTPCSGDAAAGGPAAVSAATAAAAAAWATTFLELSLRCGMDGTRASVGGYWMLCTARSAVSLSH